MTTQQSGNGINVSVLDDNTAEFSVVRHKFGRYRRADEGLYERLNGRRPSIVTEGSVPIFPSTEPERKIDSAIRNLIRSIQAVGVRRAGGGASFIVPVVHVDRLQKKADDTIAFCQAQVAEIEKDYDATFETFASRIETGYTLPNKKVVAADPDGAMVVREMKVEKSVAISKYDFGVEITSYSPLKREGRDQSKDVASMVAGLAKQLFKEVAAAMVEVLESESILRHKAGQKTLRPLKAAVEKMKGFSFVNPKLVGGCIALIEQTIGTLPKSGWIEDSPQEKSFSTLKRLVETLADEDKLLNTASLVANGKSALDVLFPKPVVAPAPAPQPVVQQPVAAATQPVAKAMPARPGRAPSTGGMPVLPRIPASMPVGRSTTPTLF